MNYDELRDRLRESIQLCSIHHQRMQYAYNKIKSYFFITEEIIEGLNALALDVMVISNLWDDLRSYCKKRFNIP